MGFSTHSFGYTFALLALHLVLRTLVRYNPITCCTTSLLPQHLQYELLAELPSSFQVSPLSSRLVSPWELALTSTEVRHIRHRRFTRALFNTLPKSILNSEATCLHMIRSSRLSMLVQLPSKQEGSVQPIGANEVTEQDPSTG